MNKLEAFVKSLSPLEREVLHSRIPDNFEGFTRQWHYREDKQALAESLGYTYIIEMYVLEYRKLRSFRKVAKLTETTPHGVASILKAYGEPIRHRGGARDDNAALRPALIPELRIGWYDKAARAGESMREYFNEFMATHGLTADYTTMKRAIDGCSWALY